MQVACCVLMSANLSCRMGVSCVPIGAGTDSAELLGGLFGLMVEGSALSALLA
jgi:hypothetical protein